MQKCQIWDTGKLNQGQASFLFFLYPPPPGLLPVLGPLGSWTDATHLPCPALPCGSTAGVILGRTSGSEVDASPVWERLFRRNLVCLIAS